MIKPLILSLLGLSLAAAGPATTWDFEKETPTLEQGWTATSDQAASGSSYVLVRAENDGANHALRLVGNVASRETGPAAGLVQPFAGAIHFFSATPFRPADLSAATTLSFRVKGASKVAEVALFQQARGFVPATKAVTVTPEWTEYRFPLSAFGVDTRSLTAVAIGRASEGNLDILVDDIRIQ